MTNITGNTIFGLFKSGVTDLTELTSAEITLSPVECREPMFIMLDLTSLSSDTVLTVLDENGNATTEIDVTAGKLNIIPMTTEGLMDGNGNIKLQIGAFDGIKAAVVGYTPVINH